MRLRRKSKLPSISDAIFRDMTEFRIATGRILVEVFVSPSVAGRLRGELPAEWDGRTVWGAPLWVSDDVTTWQIRGERR